MNNKTIKCGRHHNRGFTIVELLVVIVVIGILAAISITAYSGIQDRARITKMNSDLTELSQAIQAARNVTSKTLGNITGNYWTGGGCLSKPAGTDIASLPKTDACWTQYASALNQISLASGMNVNGLTDSWGRPYYIDENEGEGGGCSTDTLAVLVQPFNGSIALTPNVSVPLSGYSGCSI